MEGDLLLGAFFFLAAAVVVVPFDQRGGLGSVLGYLVTGVAIGPYGLRLVSNPESILHFAEFGVVMMLFLIGLELEPAKLWRLRRTIVGLGGAQVTLTAGAIAAIALAFGQTWQAGIAIGLALALSSTAIALQILNERNVLGTAAGQSAFSVLLFQDVAVIPILAVLPLLAAGDGGSAAAAHAGALGGPAWLRAVTVIGAVAGIVTAGRYLLRPVFRFIASTGIREIFTAFSLLLVVGIALLMQSIGLSAALGTFLAGVVLANSEYRIALESDIEPFKALFLGLFFISVGMSIQFSVLAEAPRAIARMLAGLIAVKLVLLAALARAFCLGRDQNLLFSFVLAPGGEFGFVLFQFAATEGALTPAQTEPLIVVVALSMALTPLLLLLLERVIQQRLRPAAAEREADAIEPRGDPVIVIGYGRFGKIVGRFLGANGVGTVVLGNDPDHIEVLRKFGARVFYGDATRLDLLEKAGGDRAKLIIIAIGDTGKTVEAVTEIRGRFRNARILARARNRTHAHQLIAAGVDMLRRETFDSALVMGREALIMLGDHPYDARRRARVFEEYDERSLREGVESRDDVDGQVSLSRQLRDQLEGVFRADRSGSRRGKDDDWGN